jgi:hypothetical protein
MEFCDINRIINCLFQFKTPHSGDILECKKLSSFRECHKLRLGSSLTATFIRFTNHILEINKRANGDRQLLVVERRI